MLTEKNGVHQIYFLIYKLVAFCISMITHIICGRKVYDDEHQQINRCYKALAKQICKIGSIFLEFMQFNFRVN